MRFKILCAALVSVSSLSGAAIAQDAPAAQTAPITVKRGAKIISADSKTIGRVDAVSKAKDGSPIAAAVIYDSRYVRIPVSTLTPADGGFKTSLTRAEVSALR